MSAYVPKQTLTCGAHPRGMFRKTPQPEGLLSVLLSKTAGIDDRSEAAQDLGAYDAALPILIEAAQNASEDDSVAESIGEAVADFWSRIGGFDRELVERMHPAAKLEIGLRFKL